MSTTRASSPEQQTSDVEMRALLEKAVAALPEDFRAVFVLRAVEGMSGAEVAECLGIAEETVKTRLFRARRRLQEMLVQSIEPSLPSIYEFHLSRCDRVVAAVLHRIGPGQPRAQRLIGIVRRGILAYSASRSSAPSTFRQHVPDPGPHRNRSRESERACRQRDRLLDRRRVDPGVYGLANRGMDRSARSSQCRRHAGAGRAEGEAQVDRRPPGAVILAIGSTPGMAYELRR